MKRSKLEMKRPILWQPTEKQREFLSCPAREVLFSGSVGSGKSDAILMAALSQVKNGRHQALVLRKSFPQLRDLIRRSHELFLPLRATFNKGTSQWTFPGGAIVEFGFSDADEDVYRYMGRQFSCICWDELTSWPNDSSYVYMLSRLRAVEGSGLRLEVRSSCTSGGVGHAWVRERWNIPDDGGPSEVIDKQTGYRRVFIPARIGDNPYLANTEYARSLKSLPQAQYKALVEGRWDVYEGAVFGEFNPSMHVCEPFAVPNEWRQWRGCDDGFANPLACLWVALDEVYDRIYVTAELYQSQLTPETAAAVILAMDGGRDLDGVIDSASFADTGMVAGGGGRADVMNKFGCAWRPAPKGPASRLAGIALIHQRLAKRADGQPGLMIFSTCKNLIRELQGAVYSRTNVEDIDDSCSQHAIDALRYGLVRHKPAEVHRVRVSF
jgi:Terminase large subunit, T4likevirus-type, N-terminal